MKIRYVIRQLGFLIIVLSVTMLAIAALVGLVWPDGMILERADLRALGITVVVGLLAGSVLALVGHGAQAELGRREALLLVALSWLVGAALAGLPYWIWAHISTAPEQAHPFRGAVSCYFEAMSGLTTTGATVLSDIESLPRGLLLWRATTQWLGGVGIVVLFVAVLPTLGVGGKKLFQIEAPGPTQAGVRPRIGETARVLWMIYFGLTIAEILALRLCGMNWFDALCHTFATLATGGFSTKNAGMGAQQFNLAMEITIIVFMVLAGVNFGLYYQIIRRRFSAVWKDPELRLYLAIILIASVIVTWGIYHQPIEVTEPGQVAPGTLGQAARYGVFQVVSIQTTTGFCTANFETWDFVPKMALLALMFVGASAGSTGGGIKVIRILIAFKVMIAEIERLFRPNVVRTIKVGGMTVEPELRLGVLVYLLGIGALFLIGAVALMALEGPGQINFATAATASAATLNNIGPGLAKVGAVENYGWFSAPSKILMSLLMVLGRLEVYAIFVLFVPRFWRSE